LITLVDLEAPSAPSLDMLRSTFALTRREADIARRIATGASLDAIAAGAGLKLSTARQILKALLAKTDTHKQAELVALLARMSEG
jgi:DNA-binding CsgD family transcriptional regulator